MALSASLLLRQNQSLVMTPQLMQSIQLLQMTHIELVSFIAQEVEKNPLLEIAANDNDPGETFGSDDTTSAQASDSIESSHTSETAEWYGDDAPVLNEALDTNFSNVFPDDESGRKADAPELLGQWKSMPGAEAGDDYDLDDFVARKPSLRDHIAQQVPFSVTGLTDSMTADALLDHLDETRRDVAALAFRLEDHAAAMCGSGVRPEHDEEIRKVRHGESERGGRIVGGPGGVALLAAPSAGGGGGGPPPVPRPPVPAPACRGCLASPPPPAARSSPPPRGAGRSCTRRRRSRRRSPASA